MEFEDSTPSLDHSAPSQSVGLEERPNAAGGAAVLPAGSFSAEWQ